MDCNGFSLIQNVFLKDWRDEAQRRREDIDTGLADIKKQCDSCQKIFSREKDYRYHKKGCGNVCCTQCDKTFPHKIALKNHMAKEHLREFQCSVCQKCFVNKRNLERHNSVHSGREKIMCKFCGRGFSTKSNLTKHLILHK